MDKKYLDMLENELKVNDIIFNTQYPGIYRIDSLEYADSKTKMIGRLLVTQIFTKTNDRFIPEYFRPAKNQIDTIIFDYNRDYSFPMVLKLDSDEIKGKLMFMKLKS